MSVFVLNHPEAAYEEIQKADEKVRAYLRMYFQKLLSQNSIDEAVAAVLDYGKSKATHERAKKVTRIIGSR